MKISVSHSDIVNGRRCDSVDCPVSLAIRRTCPEYVHIRTWGKDIELALAYKLSFTLDSPTEVWNFTQNFDAREPVEPFDFWLELP